ncbi:MAG: hypothetical protein KAJ37_09545 [Candidatus Krumholzibacteria bacterium]|nr:hypothetical protein [Candidatus Krumholzibacteria bacterium]
MGVGESVFRHLNAQREAERQYRFEFMPPAKDEGPYSFTLETSEATVHVVADDLGDKGLMLDSLRITGSDGQMDGDASGLMRLVERIVTEVECPYGPIKCIENDERLTSAVLRTDPTAQGLFFEIIVNGGGDAELRHYTVSVKTRERKRTSVNLGKTAFANMADALAGVFRPNGQSG